ncbi:hypothetical protein GUITHDRAFT_132689 [Guillardia theta CCMP2712]|uniref:ribonuclease Z n=1 Tax=Guillardia theta (strain CCMP2712) TaxID=905079 RepID=L1JZN6_GUITC|nr:hypothetical protein GUITHDRAFT_132689 [Guillardia theta CCMP2712]EKX53583.1 hypothetical protein GUITHDRAFT_132689 [Guillardia theta CCMP2712]|eukprot:XP_005840563.1 hypothetical protein GUITHDRAFT_132689 [Guillardia theta CCMP2712]
MSNTHSLLQSAANYGPESPPSICITTAKDRILINCPEGTQGDVSQRLMTENKLKLTNKASSFFFTQNNWEYITGITDCLLKMSEEGQTQLNLTGAVLYIVLNQSRYLRLEMFIQDSAAFKQRMERRYHLQFPDLPGKFDVKKAEELKVPKGPMRGKLVKGETIVLEDGRKISPSDCVGPGAPGGLVCVIDCPSSLHVKSLQEENVLNRMIYFVHMSPDEVLESEEYAQFTSKIPSCLNITHVIHDNNNEEVVVVMVEGRQLRRSNSKTYLRCVRKISQAAILGNFHHVDKLGLTLLKVDEKFFAPSACQYPSLLSFGPEKSGNIPRREYDRMKNIRATCGWPMQVFILPPHKQTGLKDSIPETSMMHYYCLKGCICNEEERGKLYKPFEERKAQMMENEKTSETSPNIKILFLGTGASAPFKYRTVSSILVELEDGSGVLLDAGDGTYSAMVRKMGQQKAEDILKKLKMICVSHKHADHISGVARILLKRQGLMQVKAEESRLSSDCTWECSVCGKRFTSRSSIELHQKAVHPRNIREPKKVEQDNERYSSPQDLLVIGPMWLEAWLQDLSRLENIPFTYIALTSILSH